VTDTISTTVPLVDLAAQHRQVADEVAAGWADVLAQTAFVGGPQVAAFEREYADYLGVPHCVGVGNGTDALEFALRAAGIGPGDECVLPANTFIATAEAVVRCGATPVLVDCDQDTALIDPDAVAAATTRRTRALLPVHLYGQVAPMERLLPIADRVGALIVEDAAQAQGALRYGRAAGTFGALAATSFYPGKNLGAYGDAGAVLSTDTDLAAQVRLLRDHGSARRYEHDVLGFNSRMDTLQAVVLSAKLRHLDRWNAGRRRAAQRYDDLLAGLPAVGRPVVADGNDPVWHLYVVLVPARDRVLAGLRAAGIGAGLHYPTPIHRTGAFARLGLAAGAFPATEHRAEHLLSLPLFPEITATQQERVVEVLAKTLAEVC
jgi:dTDP-4-amino-4,6-dideoxygalactose transaminase